MSLLASAVVRDSVVRMLLAFAAAVSLVWFAAPRRAGTWLLAEPCCSPCGEPGLVSHAASRIDAQSALGLLTAIHVAGAMLWAGGVMHLLLCWRLLRRADDTTAWRCYAASRRSMVGMLAIVLPAACWRSNWSVGAGLLGTGHGIMLLIKLGFLALALARCELSRRARPARRRGGGRHGGAGTVEVETGLAFALPSPRRPGRAAARRRRGRRRRVACRTLRYVQPQASASRRRAAHPGASARTDRHQHGAMSIALHPCGLISPTTRRA